MGTPAYDRAAGAAMVALTVGHRVVDRLTGGRVGRRLGPVPAVWLTTTGRRSGQPRRTPLVAARDGDDADAPYLVAGSAGGREEAPAWSHNLRAHAETGEPAGLQVGDVHLLVDVEEMRGAERDRCFAAMVRLASNFASYERHATRTIPVFRLTPRDDVHDHDEGGAAVTKGCRRDHAPRHVYRPYSSSRRNHTSLIVG